MDEVALGLRQVDVEGAVRLDVDKGQVRVRPVARPREDEGAQDGQVPVLDRLGAGRSVCQHGHVARFTEVLVAKGPRAQVRRVRQRQGARMEIKVVDLPCLCRPGRQAQHQD